MKKPDRSIFIFALSFCLAVFFGLTADTFAQVYTDLSDYNNWAVNIGYPQGYLVPGGITGINQDYFHSGVSSAACESGKIVIGDSRCCQLGILQERMGRSDFAVYAVWGGHYVYGIPSPILAADHIYEIEQCFQQQIRTQGKSTVYFFATVNDYDYLNNNNSGYISAAVSSAELIASMAYTYAGTVHHPEVIMIGFDGPGGSWTASNGSFNRYVDSYNADLREAVRSSSILRDTAALFTTVPEITGGDTTFISDGLHYSDTTLGVLTDHLTGSH